MSKKSPSPQPAFLNIPLKIEKLVFTGDRAVGFSNTKSKYTVAQINAAKNDITHNIIRVNATAKASQKAAVEGIDESRAGKSRKTETTVTAITTTSMRLSIGKRRIPKAFKMFLKVTFLKTENAC